MKAVHLCPLHTVSCNEAVMETHFQQKPGNWVAIRQWVTVPLSNKAI